MAAAKSQKERNDIQEYWISVDREQEAALINKIENEYLSFIHSETLTNSNNSEFAWTKDDLGKSVTQNVLSEVGNQPWVGYVYYAENASKFTRTVAKSGGPVAIGFLIKDFYTDYQMYSVRELAKAWGADLIPVVSGFGGGVVGSVGGPVGAFSIGVIGATAGDYAKDRIKYDLKKDTDK